MRSEDGAVAVTTAIVLVMLIGLMAFIVDYGLVRADIRESQRASDAGALAGASALEGGPGDYREACEAAWTYLTANLSGTAAAVPSSCANFGDALFLPSGVDCLARAASAGEPTTNPLALPPAPVYIQEVWGSYTIRIQIPVRDIDDQMTVQPGDLTFDGTNPCERIGVSVRHERDSVFGSFAGGGASASGFADAVARHFVETGESFLPSLVVLDRGPDCEVLRTDGNNGTIYVKSFVDSDGTSYPGTVVVDTRASSVNPCGAPQNPVFRPGSGTIKADGYIYSYAMQTGANTADVYNPSDVIDGHLSPVPVAAARVLRASIDHRYNCTTYPQDSEPYLPESTWLPAIYRQDGVDDCSDRDPYLKELYDEIEPMVTAVNDVQLFQAAGFNVYGDDASEPCNDIRISAADAALIGSRRWYFDCETAAIKTDADELTLPDIDIAVFRGGLSNKGTVTLNGSAVRDTIVVVWDGDVANNDTFALHRGVLYLNQGSFQNQSTNANATLIAPDGDNDPDTPCDTSTFPWPGADCFEDLAVWQNGYGTGSNEDIFDLHGSGAVVVEGTVFVPNAKVDVGGGSGSDLTDAQFFAWEFNYSGQGTLTLIPNPDRSTQPPNVGIRLIR